MSQVKEIKHHTQEIESILNKNTKVESWVLAKAERSSTDLSDITHYLDGKVQEMEKGGRYNTGRAWTLDHNQHNKSEDYEVPNRNRKMANGGEIFEDLKKKDMLTKAKIVTVIGFDEAYRYIDREYVVSPYSLIQSAVRKGFITIDEINKDVWESAVEESNDIEERYADSGEGIGSSDMNAFIYSMLNNAGIKVGVVDNKYQRMANGGEVEELEIDFEEEDNDILVEYKIKIDDKELEIFGKLKTYNSGRGENYQFEPDYFSDSDSEKFYDENWELVEDQIINAYDTKYADGGLMAKGGSIPNNYRGRTTEDIWNNLSENQRTHFMLDHFNELFILENEVVMYANKEFKSLNENIKNAFKVHTIMGQYADGGEIDEDNMGVKFIDYKGKSIMFEPHFKKYYSNDVEFDSLEKAKKYIDSGSKSPDWERLAYKRGMMARGGKTKIKSYKEYKEELINIANKSNSESEFVDKAKSSLKEYIPMYFSDVRMDIFGIKDADWNKMIQSPSKYSKELESVSLGNAYNKLKSSSKSTSKVKESKDEYKDDRRMSKAKTYWNTFNENNRGQYLLSAGYSKIKSENLSKNSWDSLDKEVHMRLRSVLLADGGMMAKGGISDSDIYYGVVDSNNKLVFQSKNEREAKLVSNSYEGSVVKKYKGKAKIYEYAEGGMMANGGKTSGVEWDKDEDGYRTELGTFKINISPSTERGYWDVYVSENKKSIGQKYDVYGIDKAKDEAYNIISNLYKMADGGVTSDEKVKSISESLLKRKKVSPSVQKDYGKTYSKKEAVESAKRIAGAMRAKEIRMKKK